MVVTFCEVSQVSWHYCPTSLDSHLLAQEHDETLYEGTPEDHFQDHFKLLPKETNEIKDEGTLNHL